MNEEPELDSEELEAIARRAAQLPLLSPSRDLWSGVEARIEAPVVALPVTLPAAPPMAAAPIIPAQPVVLRQPARHQWRRMAIAASLLVAVTAGVTYTITMRHAAAAAATDSSGVAAAEVAARGAASGAAFAVEPVSNVSAEQTFDREIAAMRKIIDERRGDLDPATIGVLEKNLKVIDAAIAESKAALARDPASTFLLDRLTHAYDSKLQFLRGVASIPSRG